MGMLSPSIKAAEEMLEAVGYEPGEIDGLFDEKTTQAVKKLQKDLALDTTGILLGETTYGLMEKLRTKIQEDDPQLIESKRSFA